MEAVSINAVYAERAKCVLAIARHAVALGCRAGFAVDPSEPGWPLLFIELPTGQCTWHFAKSERDELGDDIPDVDGFVWDGHSTEEKYRRLDAWGRSLMGPKLLWP